MTQEHQIKHNLVRVNARIAEAAQACDRDPNDIQLLAVSKTKPVSDIVLAYENGQRLFGENYVQEGVDKIHQMTDFSDIVWHFIGPLQSNKSKIVAENFHWIHSVDRLKIAKRLNMQRPSKLGKLNICIQVNIDDDENKSGIAVAQLDELIEQVQTLENLTCRGLMTIPKANTSETELKNSFAKMRELFDKYQQKFEHFDTLSMGMSSDLDLAISQGSTMVRVGTDIFGARK